MPTNKSAPTPAPVAARVGSNVNEAADSIYNALKKDSSYSNKISRPPQSDGSELIVINDIKLGYAADETVFKNVTIKIRVIDRTDLVIVKLCIYGKPNDNDDDAVEVEIQRLLTYINFGMLYGTFEMKPVTSNSTQDSIPPGTLRYRRTITIVNSSISKAGSMLKDATEKGCDIVACFSEMIELVKSHKYTQEKAIQRKLGKIKDSQFYKDKVEECFDSEVRML